MKYLLLMFSMALSAADLGTFPIIKASDLNKKEIVLPTGLAGERNVVLIAFQREQQTDVDTWLKPLPALLSKRQNVRYYELPTIGRGAGMFRMFIDNGMRSGIPDKAQRERTITLYLDKEPFKKALQLGSENQIHALLLDKAGKVLWRAEGRFDEAKGKSLEAVLK
jgi:hypothetical protein